MSVFLNVEHRTSNVEHRRAKVNPKPWEFRASGMKLVVVTQWVRVERSNSHLATKEWGDVATKVRYFGARGRLRFEADCGMFVKK